MITITKIDKGNVKIHFDTGKIVYLVPECDVLLDTRFPDNVVVSSLTAGDYSFSYKDVQSPIASKTFSTRQELQKILSENFFYTDLGTVTISEVSGIATANKQDEQTSYLHLINEKTNDDIIQSISQNSSNTQDILSNLVNSTQFDYFYNAFLNFVTSSNLKSVIDSSNSSTTPLLANATFTGSVIDLESYGAIGYSVKADKAGASNGLYIEFSQDGLTWDRRIVNDYGSDHVGKIIDLLIRKHDRYARVVFVNGSQAQGTFSLVTTIFKDYQIADTRGIDHVPVSGDDGLLTVSKIVGKTTAGGGTYVDVKVNPSGALTTESTLTNDIALNGSAVTGENLENGGTNVLGWLSSLRKKIGLLTDLIVSGASTNVKGLRVYTGPTDPISDIPVHIEYSHHQIHEGETYKYVNFGTLNQSTRDIRISVPTLTATTRTPHFLFEVVSDNTTCTVSFYEGTTFTSGGTDDSSKILNRNRNSTNAAVTKVYVNGVTALTVNALGTLLDNNYIFTSKAATNAERDMAEWDLKSSTEYLVRIVTTGNGTVLCKLHWYEDLGV